ncbi:MAG: glycosyltransferase family 39 protein [Candidatus Levybacteria bacterium]|nr:glycosyltransferase family 39 protein [Candidatus Levybacteria bacterium]
MINSVKFFILLLIFSFGFLVRLYGFHNPIADWHSWRQADTSSVSRNFAEHGFDILHPKFDDISNVPSMIDNPQGYRFVEFPIYNVFQAGLFKLFGIFSIEEWGRIVSIVSSLFAGLFLYLIVRKYSGERVGLFALFFYIFLPYNIYYSRTILPDTTMVAAILGGIYFFDRWIQSRMKNWLLFSLATICTTSSILLKPYALFYIFVFLTVGYSAFGGAFFKNRKVQLFGLLAITPFMFWRMWMTQFPEGIPASSWLFNGNGIRFRPSYFRWIIFERLIKLISGFVGITFFLSGIYSLGREKNRLIYFAFILGALLYLTVFATGNVQHDYYQVVIMPVVAMMYALGASAILSIEKIKFLLIRWLIIIILTIPTLYFAWEQVKGYYYINNPAIIAAGEAVDRLTPKDAKVITSYNGDTSFLYQTKRKGWSSFQTSISGLINMGANYLIFANPNASELNFISQYKVVERGDNYIIYDLRKKP